MFVSDASKSCNRSNEKLLVSRSQSEKIPKFVHEGIQLVHMFSELSHSFLSFRSPDKSHKIPRGDWFEYVSCPHYLAEILIYFSIQIVLGFDHTLFLAAFIFTLANQTAASKFVHRWYRDTFPDYPKDRMAVFPWVL